MAVLWNLLAGYAGMISFGQQAYLGIGAYLVWLVSSKTGLSPFAGIVAAAAGCAVAAVPIFALIRRLAGGYFAVATWVVAECLFLYVTNQLWLGGGTGVGLQQLSGMAPVLRNAYTYWTALGLTVVIVAGVYLLVRSRFGLDSRAVHDDRAAAAAMGVEVPRTRWLAYLIAATGFGAVGGMLIISTLYIDPATVFNVNYSADMLFMVVIGGLGTMEGPIIGAVIFFAVQEKFAAVRGVVPGSHRRGGHRRGAGRARRAVGPGGPPRLGTAPGRLPHPGRRGAAMTVLPRGDDPPSPPAPPVGGKAETGYTTSTAFLEALREAGIRYAFANLGSDHTGFIEAYSQAARLGTLDQFPELVLCPHESVALSAAHGYAQISGEPQAVLVHTDVGTQSLGGAIHNASRGRVPVLIFAGLSPVTQDGELRGTRTEHIHWLQDTMDQRGMLRGYVKHDQEIRTGRNVKQLVHRAVQLARSEPAARSTWWPRAR